MHNLKVMICPPNVRASGVVTESVTNPAFHSSPSDSRRPLHVQRVQFYEALSNPSSPTPHKYCYRDAPWGLVALHIIQKTLSAPYFIYASFEQTDNLLTSDGKPVEDDVGELLNPEPVTATTPQVCLIDTKPQVQAGPIPDPDMPSHEGRVIVTSDPTICTEMTPAVYCDAPGKRLFYKNEFGAAPTAGNICVNKRDNALPQYVKDANRDAHSAISAYLQNQNPRIQSAPWLYYKLVNVQYYPYDKEVTTETPNGSLYTSKPPYTAKNPAPSSFYMANIVVETKSGAATIQWGFITFSEHRLERKRLVAAQEHHVWRKSI